MYQIKSKPIVSVIIPTYNRANWLKKSIESVLQQSFHDFELIVVDDGSTDKTSDVIKSFRDERIRYFRLQKSGGAAVARNLGIKKAKGKYIAFNDDDNIWRKRKLEKQIAVMEKANKKVGVVYSGIIRIKSQEKIFLPQRKAVIKEGDIHRDLFLENLIVDLPTALVRRECFEKAGLFDENFPRYQDWELWLRISKYYDFKYLPLVLVDSFVLEKGIHSDDKALFKATELIFKKHRKEIEDDNCLLASWHFRIGDLYYHRKNMREARKHFIKAFSARSSFKYFRAIVKTILGKRISETLISFKISLIKNWHMIAILGLALILRLINLNQSLWLDEAVQAITSKGPFLGIFQELRGDFHPPLYHLLMWVWVHLFGSSEIILRLPSVLFGVTTVYLAYLIGKVVSEQWLVVSKKQNQPPTTSHQPLPLLAAIFMATAPFHIYYSQEARNYAMATFLATLSMYYFIRVVSEQWLVVSKKQNQPPTTSYQPLIGYLLSTTLLLYTNYFGLFILFAQTLVTLWRREFKNLLLMFYCLLLFVPDLFLLKIQLITGHQATTSLPEWGRLVNVNFLKALPLTFIKFSIGRITFFNKKIYTIVAGILFIIYGGIIGKVIGDQWSVIRKKKQLDAGHRWLITVFLWLVVPILCAWLLSLFIPNYQPFRLLLVLPAFYLLLAFGISKFSVLMIRIILIILVIIINLFSISIYYVNPYFYREDWRGVVQFIELQPKEKTIALLPSQTSYWPYEYYSSGKVRLIGISSGIKVITHEDLDNLTIEQFNNRAIYYIRYLVPMFDPQEQTVLWLNQNGFVKIREVSFNQIPVWIYRRHQ